MSNDNEKPAKPAADSLAKELKSSLAKDRPRTWLPVLVLVVLCSAILGGLLWWLLPRGRPPVLQVVALDEVVTTGETPTARGQLFAPDDAESVRLSGHDIAFDDQQKQAKVVKSDGKGLGIVPWQMGDEAVAAFFVRFVDRDNRTGSAKEYGRLFVWPKDARIVVVDADETLAEESEESAVALNKAIGEGWRLAYTCVASSKAQDFRQARSKLDEKVKLPKGPILSRSAYPASESVESARREVIQALQGKFKGDMLAIVKNADASKTCQDLGLRVIRIGDAASPTWAEVVVK